jgi:hypothetical protein
MCPVSIGWKIDSLKSAPIDLGVLSELKAIVDQNNNKILEFFYS